MISIEGEPSASPSASPDPLAEARALASGVPCSVLDVRSDGQPGQPVRLLVSGLGSPGQGLEALNHQLSGEHRVVSIATEKLDPGFCPALETVADSVRRARAHQSVRLTVADPNVPIGGKLMVTVQTASAAALYLDLYAADGSVQHLQRGPLSRHGGGAEAPMVVPASGPTGQRLLVAIATSAPLNIANRPQNEVDTIYLPLLQRALTEAAPGGPSAAAEAATVNFVHPMSPPSPRPSKPQSSIAANRGTAPFDPRCARIVERVGSGEELTETDRLLLQTSCHR